MTRRRSVDGVGAVELRTVVAEGAIRDQGGAIVGGGDDLCVSIIGSAREEGIGTGAFVAVEFPEFVGLHRFREEGAPGEATEKNEGEEGELTEGKSGHGRIPYARGEVGNESENPDGCGPEGSGVIAGIQVGGQEES